MFNRIRLLSRDERPSRRMSGIYPRLSPYIWEPSNAATSTRRGFYTATHNRYAMDEEGSTIRLRLSSCFYGPYGRPRTYSVDDAGHTVYTPVVAKLPNNRGWLAGWVMGEGMAGVVHRYVYDNERSACLAAHDVAELEADWEREYQQQEAERERQAEIAAAAATGVIL
jgi:hypothetical protein